MTQLIPLGTGPVGNTILETISTITGNYFRYKLLRDDSLDGLPYLLGNTTQTLMMTNNLLAVAKDFSGNFSDSLVPSFNDLIMNQSKLIQAQTDMIENRLICSQGMTVTTGVMLTSMSLTETICSTNMMSRLCFASATVLNGLGTVCSVTNMAKRFNRGLDPFGVLLNGFGAGCFWCAKYCQNMGNRTRWI
jgi:hypothetical protein